MPAYPYVCDGCGLAVDAVLPMSEAGSPGPLCCDRPMRRLYTSPSIIVYHDRVGYVERAYRGEEQVPGLTTQQVRSIVDTNVATAKYGKRKPSSPHE